MILKQTYNYADCCILTRTGKLKVERGREEIQGERGGGETQDTEKPKSRAIKYRTSLENLKKKKMSSFYRVLHGPVVKCMTHGLEDPGLSIIGQHTSEPQTSTGESQEIHECVSWCHDMTVIMLKAT